MKHAALLAGVLAVAGCAAMFMTSTSFTRTAAFTPSKRSPEEVLLVLRGSPAPPGALLVGPVQGTRTEWQSNADLMNALRREASRSGVDGIADLTCGLHPAFGYGCEGTGFVLPR